MGQYPKAFIRRTSSGAMAGNLLKSTPPRLPPPPTAEGKKQCVLLPGVGKLQWPNTSSENSYTMNELFNKCHDAICILPRGVLQELPLALADYFEANSQIVQKNLMQELSLALVDYLVADNQIVQKNLMDAYSQHLNRPLCPLVTVPALLSWNYPSRGQVGGSGSEGGRGRGQVGGSGGEGGRGRGRGEGGRGRGRGRGEGEGGRGRGHGRGHGEGGEQGAGGGEDGGGNGGAGGAGVLLLLLHVPYPLPLARCRTCAGVASAGVANLYQACCHRFSCPHCQCMCMQAQRGFLPMPTLHPTLAAVMFWPPVPFPDYPFVFVRAERVGRALLYFFLHIYYVVTDVQQVVALVYQMDMHGSWITSRVCFTNIMPRSYLLP